MGMMDQDILKVLYTEKQIAARIEAMGMEMYEDLKDKEPLFVSVLRGAFIFMADIVRACPVRCDVEFIAVSSYGNSTSSSGIVQITHDIQQDISGRHLVVVEDILDSGNTLSYLFQLLQAGQPAFDDCSAPGPAGLGGGHHIIGTPLAAYHQNQAVFRPFHLLLLLLYPFGVIGRQIGHQTVQAGHRDAHHDACPAGVAPQVVVHIVQQLPCGGGGGKRSRRRW